MKKRNGFSNELLARCGDALVSQQQQALVWRGQVVDQVVGWKAPSALERARASAASWIRRRRN